MMRNKRENLTIRDQDLKDKGKKIQSQKKNHKKKVENPSKNLNTILVALRNA